MSKNRFDINALSPIQVIVVVAIVSIISFFVFRNTGDSGESEDYTEYSKQEKEKKTSAYVVSTNFVKDFLKTPSSADFSLSYVSLNEYQDTFVISSYVDAQNALGVRVREDYLCHLYYNGSSSRLSKNGYTLLFLRLGDEIVYANKNMVNRYIKK